MTSRNIALALLLATLLAVLYLHSRVSSIESKLNRLEGEIQWCVWKHDNHITRLPKGSKTAERTAKMMERPSDEGDCE